MSLRVGFLGVAHMHVGAYVVALQDDPRARAISVWDSDSSRKDTFAIEHGLQQAASAEALIEECDAIIVCSENRSHAADIERIATSGKPILCEKPLVTTGEEAARVERALSGSKSRLMTAFPCRFSPAWQRLKERVNAGEIGRIEAVCATNRGKCPFDWFVDVEKSGGGAMMDHTVHVADLLRDLLGEEPEAVQAQIGANLHGKEWEDTAMLSLQYPSGAFASIDASWSRPKNFKTWGDVTLNVVGERGVLDLDMFAQDVEVWFTGQSVAGYGSNLEDLMIAEWIGSIVDDREPLVTLEDGLAASRVVFAAYASVSQGVPKPVNC